MQSWEDKKFGKGALRTYVLPAAKRAAGLTINTINGVTATVWDGSSVPDPTPSSIIDGAATKNIDPFVDGFVTVGANQAVSQLFKDGVIGCTYVVTVDLTLSNNEPFQEDITLLITKYVPSP